MIQDGKAPVRQSPYITADGETFTRYYDAAAHERILEKAARDQQIAHAKTLPIVQSAVGNVYYIQTLEEAQGIVAAYYIRADLLDDQIIEEPGWYVPMNKSGNDEEEYVEFILIQDYLKSQLALKAEVAQRISGLVQFIIAHP